MSQPYPNITSHGKIVLPEVPDLQTHPRAGCSLLSSEPWLGDLRPGFPRAPSSSTPGEMAPHGVRNPTIDSCVIPNSLEDLGRFLAICPRTLWNLVCYLHRNSPEPHQPSAPEPSGTSLAICTGTLRNLISHLHRNLRNLISPEGSGTLRNLLRNLVLQLHRIDPEFFWAKDPIASVAVGEKTSGFPKEATKTEKGHLNLRLCLQVVGIFRDFMRFQVLRAFVYS